MTWTREKIVERIRRWVELYGEPPRAADWNPSSARWCAQTWRVDRYRQGDPETGEPWPSLNAAKSPFGGSLNAAVTAAGFEPNRPGPPSRRSAVDLDERVEMHPSVRVALDAARAEARDLAAKVETRDRQLERARATADGLREELAARRTRTVTRTKTKTKVRTKTVRVGDPAAVDRAVSRALAAAARTHEREQGKVLADAVKAAEGRSAAAVREARAAATRAASKLERAEATISELRAERAELRRAARDAENALVRAESVAASALAEAETLRRSQKVIVKDAPEQAAIDAAREEVRAARAREAEAEVRAAAAERAYAEVAQAATGRARQLTRTELDELRASGPSGPALLAKAIKDLTSARAAGGNPVALRAALTAIASDAVSWRERLP